MSAGVIGLVGRLRAALGPDTDDAELLRAYATTPDADAFAALVHRHGPRVWATCRRVVGDPHAAEDAFQAVFLVLARKASGLPASHPLGGWLHTVAVNVSLRARRAADRRKRREANSEVEAVAPTPPEPPDERALAVLDEEVARLPTKLRDAVVLCELDGLSRKAAAERLGIPEGTLSSRLAAARKRLAERLKGRGVGPELLAVTAAVPTGLAEAACGLGVGTVPAPAVAALAGGAMRALLLKGLAAGAVTCGLLAVGGFAADDPSAKPADSPKASVAAEQGQLLISPDGGTHRWYGPDGSLGELFPERFHYTERAVSVSPGRRWVARVSHADGGGLFARLTFAPADGRGEDRPIDLTGDAIFNAHLHWSKDATRLLVAGATRKVKVEGRWLYTANVVDVPSGRVTPMPMPAGVMASDWSADGKRLLVIEGKGEAADLRVRLAWMPVAGGPLDYITPADEFCTRGLASADGTRVVYLKKPVGGLDRPSDLVSRLLADGRETRLADGGAGWVHTFVLSPTGTRVAYSVMPQADNWREVERAVVAVDADGRNRRTVLTYEQTGRHAGGQMRLRLIDWR